jgi:hypothetical protein
VQIILITVFSVYAITSSSHLIFYGRFTTQSTQQHTSFIEAQNKINQNKTKEKNSCRIHLHADGVYSAS